MMQTTHLAIKNRRSTPADPCGVCGGITDPIDGPEIFLADSWAPVCHGCAEDCDPLLFGLLQAHRTIWLAITESELASGFDDGEMDE